MAFTKAGLEALNVAHRLRPAASKPRIHFGLQATDAAHVIFGGIAVDSIVVRLQALKPLPPCPAAGLAIVAAHRVFHHVNRRLNGTPFRRAKGTPIFVDPGTA